MSDGLKYDGGKPPLNLLSNIAQRATAEVLAFGARKYEAHNWRKGIELSRLLAGAMRHLNAFNDGEDLDPESKLPHIDHAACCVMFVQELWRTQPAMDDRYRPGPKDLGLLGAAIAEAVGPLNPSWNGPEHLKPNACNYCKQAGGPACVCK